MSDIIRRAAKGFVPAGYLPAPQQARFISTAEEAAKRLPANIKAQSVENQLKKLGAKPLELEYAQLGQFLQGKDRVSSQEVLQHLQQQGPLGQLKRVDQWGGPERPSNSAGVFIDNDNFDPPMGLRQFDSDPEVDNGRLFPQTNFYQSDSRAPFGSDARGSFPQARHPEITVPGRRKDYTGYRESLIEDPRAKNPRRQGWGVLPPEPDLRVTASLNDRARALGRDLGNTAWHALMNDAEHAGLELAYEANGDPYFRPPLRHSVAPHWSDYWLRYNNLPDRIAIQNVQSDIGQNLSARERLAAPVIRMTDEEADQIVFRWEAGEEVDEELLQQAGRQIGHPDFDWVMTPATDDNSPLAHDNNWKNLMLRHALLESVNQGGKPITLPTGRQMVDVEQFGRLQATKELEKQGISEDHPRFDAEVKRLQIEKANALNEDYASRLMKILREIHPKGGALERFSPPETRLDDRPGWTITPHPETVRAALQKGVPIMSLAPLLLAPQEEQR